ncbi:MAG: MarR family transcriptional regulator [Chloroflexota bacterium]
MSMIHYVRRLLDLAHHLRQQLEVGLRGVSDLTFERVMILSFVENRGGQATISQLADDMSRTSHTITSTVGGLERRGLVTRMRGIDGDGRRVQVSVTNAGEVVLERCLEALSELVEPLLLRDDPEAKERLVAALTTLEELFQV